MIQVKKPQIDEVPQLLDSNEPLLPIERPKPASYSRRSRSQFVKSMKSEFRKSWDFANKNDLYNKIKYENGMIELEDDVSENKRWESVSQKDLRYQF